MNARTNTSIRLIAAGAIAAAGVGMLAAPASAHVEIEEGTVVAGSESTVTFGLPHGCDTSPTTAIRIQIPEEIVSAVPTQNANWNVTTVTAELDQPVDVGEGETVTERVTEVDFTARTPMPDGVRDDFRIAVAIPEDAAGSTLVFPTIQECVEGRTDWTQIAEDGQDPEELEHPAPTVEVVAAAEDPVDTTAAPTADDDVSGNGLATAALIVGIAGVVLGLAATVIAAKRPTAG